MSILQEISNSNSCYEWAVEFSNRNSMIYDRIIRVVSGRLTDCVYSASIMADTLIPTIQVDTVRCISQKEENEVERLISVEVGKILEQEDVEVELSEIYEFAIEALNGNYEKIKKAIEAMHDNMYGFVGISLDGNVLKASALTGLRYTYPEMSTKDTLIFLAKEKLKKVN